MFGRLEDAWAPVEITGVNSRRAEREDRRGKPGFWLGRPIVPLEIPLVRKTNATPLHPRCDGKSAQALEYKGVVERPLRQRVRKMKKEKGIDENGARKLQMRDFVRSEQARQRGQGLVRPPGEWRLESSEFQIGNCWYTPGSFRKSCKQRTWRIRKMKECASY